MKKGVSITVSEDGTVLIDGWGKRPVKIHGISRDYFSSYLSWENASYAYANEGEEEADDYLLWHALQDNKKLCVSIYTKHPESIIKHFELLNNCDTYIKKLEAEVHSGYSIVFAVRKGCLADFYDMDQIEDILLGSGYRIGKLELCETVPLIDFVTGKFEWDVIPFNTYLNTSQPDEDPVLSSFGNTALVITGLIFGYPLAMIFEAMRCC